MSEEYTEDRPKRKKRSGKKRRPRPTDEPLILKAPSHLRDYELEQWETLNDFEEKAWSDMNKGLSTGFDGIDKAIGGLQTGMHVIGGDSNIGKTSFISQMAFNVATKNPDAYVIDISLDDPMLDKVSRVIAAGKRVLINAVKTPEQYKKFPKMLQRRSDGLKELRGMVNCYKTYDQNMSSEVEKIKEVVKQHIVDLKEAGEKRQVCVFIDNFHDLTTDDREAQGSDKAKFTYLASFISDMATELDIPIVCSAEFKKLNGFRRPAIDDLREAVKIKYEAKSIMLCYNEVSLKGESAAVYFEKAGEDEKQPVYEVKFAKNKYSKFKGRVFFEGYPEMAYFIEADEASTKRYNNVIYSNE
jgi:replicative DNA helicase